ncbi:MAG TPA: arylsulfatase [Planctomycetota bacterium]|nr:arylsulfatase [Planctomycetota bacterium]
MNRRRFLQAIGGTTLAGAALGVPRHALAQGRKKPNIVFILADDLGYGDLGCYGQKQIKTPCLDKMAAEGVRFTDAYAGSTVCAPSRCALMTGVHMGHALVRGNANVPMRPDDVTVATLLKRAGYATGIIGKWGLGEAASTGIPTKQGFDYWFGYLNQHHAHNYWPTHLWRNEEKVPLKNVVPKEDRVGGGVASERVEYSHDLFAQEALAFVEKHKDKPFFLYLALTIPHANNEAGRLGMEVPSDEPYTKEDWPQPQKNMAAMVTRMDRDLGRLFDHLKKLGLDDDTIVFFTSDNGPHHEGGNNPDFFDSNGPLRGIKRDLYEGGIRVPMIVRWPGKAKAGTTSDLPWAFWDFLPTACDIAGAEPPKGIDGISVLPAILGKEQKGHDHLYWEFHEGGFKQAVRMGKWKAVRRGTTQPIELYDLTADIGEQNNAADKHPDLVAKMADVLKSARTDSKQWPVREGPRPKPKSKK